MSINLGFWDNYMNDHVDELRREADKAHLAAQASGPGRPIRGRIADWLIATAQWVDGRPRETIVQSSA